jgi:hypothetical protein
MCRISLIFALETEQTHIEELVSNIAMSMGKLRIGCNSRIHTICYYAEVTYTIHA